MAGIARLVLNPVRAKLVSQATEWKSSSVHAGVAAKAQERSKLERLCRDIIRAAVGAA